MKTNINIQKKSVKVNFTKSIKKEIVPKMEKHGFIFDKNASLSGSFFFTRKCNMSEHVFIIGREKFWHSFSFTVGKQEKNGEFKWATLNDLNILSNSFAYFDQSDLENQIEIILSLIDNSIIPWLVA